MDSLGGLSFAQSVSILLNRWLSRESPMKEITKIETFKLKVARRGDCIEFSLTILTQFVTVVSLIDDFVPASVDPNKTSAVDFGSNGKVRVTIPNLEGSGTGRESVYQGMRKPHQKECVLIFNHETGEVVLEKLNSSMIVKKARLRQEDMTGKSFALNNHPNNNHKATHSNGLFPGPSGSQSKSSIHSDKVINEDFFFT